MSEQELRWYGWVYVAFATMVLGFRRFVFGIVTRAMARRNARRRCVIFAKLLAHSSRNTDSVADYWAEGQANFRVLKVRALLLLTVFFYKSTRASFPRASSMLMCV